MINDFIEYWTAAKTLLSGNPYSPAYRLPCVAYRYIVRFQDIRLE